MLLQGALQPGIADSARSTATSFANSAQSALAPPFHAAFGWYATGHGFAAAFTMTGLGTVLVAILIFPGAANREPRDTTAKDTRGQREGPDP